MRVVSNCTTHATTHLKKSKRKKIHLTNCCCLSIYSCFYIRKLRECGLLLLMFISLNYQRAKRCWISGKVCAWKIDILNK